MKTCSKLEVIKRNRKYFAVRVNGYACKLLIDSASDALTEGIHENIGLIDISVKTKFGTDVIYKLAAEIEEQKQVPGICTFQQVYNAIAVEQCKDLGGKWDNGTWVFVGFVQDKVEELDILFNDDIVTVEITNEKTVKELRNSVNFLGYPVARAFGRDSGAKLGDGIAMISGEIYSSGSMKNWETCIVQGSVFRLRVSRNLLEKYESIYFTYRIIEE